MPELDLEALADASEVPPVSQCTVCKFIAARPLDEQPKWDAFLAGPRTSVVVYRVMKSEGFKQITEQPVSNHRAGKHRQ